MTDIPGKFDLILDTITDGILVVDDRGVVLYANHAADRLLERKQLLGRRLAIPLQPGATHHDINLIRPSGLAWAEMRSAPVEWNGRPAYVIGLHDISLRKEAEIALRKSEAHFQALARVAPVGIFRTDKQGRFLYVNERWCEITGITAAQAQDEGWCDALCADDREHVIAEWNQAMRSRTLFNLQFRFQRPDGQIIWVIGRAEAELDAAGELLGYVGTVTDITSLKSSEERLRQAAVVFESTREGVMVTDADKRILMVNRAFTEITGYSEADCLGHTPGILRSGRHDEEYYTAMWGKLRASGHWQGEVWNRRKNGEIYPELLSVSEVRNEAGEVTNYVGVFADITQIKDSESQLQFLAHHDPLTRLPNRLLLQSRLEHGVDMARREGKLLALLMLDLDRFKDVNDRFGHLAGDKLLQQVAERLTSRLRGADTVSRLGGDEFTVLLEDIARPEDAGHVACDIITVLSKPWPMSNGIDVHIGVSVGISLFPEHGEEPEELLHHADAALYQAKNEGRGRFKYFSEDVTRAARDRICLESRLRRAIEQSELRLHFQPQFEIAGDRLIGAEALLRWQSPEEGLILPERFLRLAEETGLIAPIGHWVLQETCRQGRIWLDTGLPPLVLAVNLSLYQFQHGEVEHQVASALAESGFPAAALELELTENILSDGGTGPVATIDRLREQGVRLAIDDFGTGYSSLASLKRFPVDILKIDKSFIDGIPIESRDKEIATTIIAMGHAMRMKVLAEGVESPEQFRFLREQGCDAYQGYLKCPPLPADELEAFLRRTESGAN